MYDKGETLFKNQYFIFNGVFCIGGVTINNWIILQCDRRNEKEKGEGERRWEKEEERKEEEEERKEEEMSGMSSDTARTIICNKSLL